MTTMPHTIQPLKNSAALRRLATLLLPVFVFAFVLAPHPAAAQKIDFSKEPKATVKHYRFVGNHREESMWSALYGAKSGKIYIGLCTHAEAAHFYEFDPSTETMRHIADLAELHGERGAGINTNGKIHVRMGEDAEGNVYFGSLNEDTGPECIDPSSYLGAFWYRYRPSSGKLEVLGKISRHFGLLGMVMDPKYMRLYGLAEDGHLYMHDIAGKFTRDLGKVDDWDICRTIFADDEGNVYGSFPVAQIWKYDVKKDEVGLRAWAEAAGLPLNFYSAEELNAVPGEFTGSDFVKKTVGVDNVCERAAMLSAGEGARLIVKKTSLNGVTVAVAQQKWSVCFE